MKKQFCLLFFLGITFCLIAGVKDYGPDDNIHKREFVPPKYGNGNVDFFKDLFRQDETTKMDTTKVDEFVTKLIIAVLITKDGVPKVLNINGKDCTDDSLMNRLESFVMHKMESEAMNKWTPAYIMGTPIDYIELLPLR